MQPDDPITTVAPESAARTRGWRRLMIGHLQPSAIGFACGLGAAMGVAPIPGLQMVVATGLSWLFRLNIPLVLLASNISLGPLLLIWAAIAASIGRWMRSGAAPWDTYATFIHDFDGAGESFHAFLQAIGKCLVDWLLGSLVLMPIVGVVCGFVAYLIARLVRRVRVAPVAGDPP
jgi:uncharacterized protein (DUF2062 family)